VVVVLEQAFGDVPGASTNIVGKGGGGVAVGAVVVLDQAEEVFGGGWRDAMYSRPKLASCWIAPVEEKVIIVFVMPELMSCLRMLLMT
jgi:hypothetical protein